MQYVHHQSQDIQTRKWNFDQKWNNAQHALSRENFERSDDVDYSKRNIENKISAFKQLEANKTTLTLDNLKFQGQEADHIGRNLDNAENQYEDYSNQFEKRNYHFVSNYLQSSQAFAEKILGYSKARCCQVQRKLQSVDQNIRRKTSEQMKDLKQVSIEHIQSIMAKQTENQKNHLDTLNSSVSQSLKNMRATLKQYERKCHQSDLKIQEEIQKLDKEMFKVMDKETKEGDITYDCLLKLVQDSCAKIQYCSTSGK